MTAAPEELPETPDSLKLIYLIMFSGHFHPHQARLTPHQSRLHITQVVVRVSHIISRMSTDHAETSSTLNAKSVVKGPKSLAGNHVEGQDESVCRELELQGLKS